MTIIDPRKICQLEISVSDLNRSLLFYENVFGWTRRPADIHNFAVLDVPSDCTFGISLSQGNPQLAAANHAVIYFRSDDPAAVVATIPKHGGAVIFGPKKVPGYGVIYQIADPDGHRFGLFT